MKSKSSEKQIILQTKTLLFILVITISLQSPGFRRNNMIETNLKYINPGILQCSSYLIIILL